MQGAEVIFKALSEGLHVSHFLGIVTEGIARAVIEAMQGTNQFCTSDLPSSEFGNQNLTLLIGLAENRMVDDADGRNVVLSAVMKTPRDSTYRVFLSLAQIQVFQTSHQVFAVA